MYHINICFLPLIWFICVFYFKNKTTQIYFRFLLKGFALKKKIELVGNSLEIQWLGLGAFTTKVWVQPLVGELRYHKPHDVAKNGGKKKRYRLLINWRLKKYRILGPVGIAMKSHWSCLCPCTCPREVCLCFHTCW